VSNRRFYSIVENPVLWAQSEFFGYASLFQYSSTGRCKKTPIRLSNGYRGGSKLLIDHMPKRGNCFSFAVEKVFKKTDLVQKGWISISFTVIAYLRHPVTRFSGLDSVKESGWIQIWVALIV
jgi:hypothetical protein